jgi:hypothetical protein
MIRLLFSNLSPRIFSYLVAAVLCFGVGVPAWAQFETRATNPFPEGAYSIATGDFNNDGKLDVVMITNNGFSVALGNGDGTLQKAVTYTTQLAYSLAAADFNGDGKLDIVVANENEDPSTVSVYLGNGDGTFQAPIDSNTTDYNEFVAVGDFNGDGKPDIVVIENPSISVLLGNGDGTFQPPSDNNSFVGAHWLTVADFNNDHKLDVLVAGYFGAGDEIGVLLGNGNGTLQDSLTYPIEYVPASVAAGDLNGDGNMDAVLGYDLGGIAVFLGNGDGSFQPAVNYDTTGLASGEIVVRDLNLDGKLDVANPSDPMSGNAVGIDLFWGNGDGTLQPAEFFSSGAESGLPAVGDLNGDGRPDFALGNTFFGVITMLNTGVASFSPTSPLVFRAQLINTKSATQVVTLKNSGTGILSIQSIKASAQFQVSDTCGSSLLVGASCAIKAAFDPTNGGAHSGVITIIDSASSKPQFIQLSGSGTVLKTSPGSLKFGNVTVGSKSAPLPVIVTNEGGDPIQFASIYVGGTDKKDFSQTDSCLKRALQPAASCTVNVTFAPTQSGALSAQLYISLQNAVDPVPIPLSGTGI